MAKKKKGLVVVMQETLLKIDPLKLSVKKQIKLAILAVLIVGFASVIFNSKMNFRADVVSDQPSITIFSPKTRTKLSDRTIISARADSQAKINKLFLIIDEKNFYQTDSGTLEYVLRASDLKAGSHTITIEAYDLAGHKTSRSISVTK